MKKRVSVFFALVLCLALCGCGPKEVTEADFLLELDGVSIEGSYTGTLTQNLPNGTGRFDAGSFVYNGSWVDGKLSGNGSITGLEMKIPYGEKTYTGTYEGEVVDGIPQGHGIFTETEGGFAYEGMWSDGATIGTGTVTELAYILNYNEEDFRGIYSGGVENGVLQGKGSFSGTSVLGGLTYDGGWTVGQFSGEGTLVCPNMNFFFEGFDYTGSYNGGVLDGKPNGEGLFTYESLGDFFLYTGTWAEGEMAGKGTMNTSLYVLHAKDSLQTGTYEGSTVDGKASGTGTFSATNYNGDDYIYIGEWKDGLCHGQGLRRYDNKGFKVEKGTFTEGEFTPTPFEFLTILGNDEDSMFKITAGAGDILRKYPDVFTKGTLDGTPLKVDSDFTYGAYIKDPDAAGGVIFGRGELSVLSIYQNHLWDTDYSLLVAANADRTRYYSTYFFGKLEDISVGSTITLTALPLDYYSFPSESDDTRIQAIVCAGISIK